MAERMTNADNFWLCMDEPTNLMVITGFMEFAKPLDFNRLYATIESRLASFPRFHRRIVRPKTGLGVPSWETDKHFDLRSHLQRVALPKPGDKATLQEMVANLAVTPLDPNKPLWQVHLIENYGDGCLLFSRLHHSIADGIALMYVMLSMCDEEPDGEWEMPAVLRKRRRSIVGRVLSPATAAVQTTRRMGAMMGEGMNVLLHPLDSGKFAASFAKSVETRS